MASRPLVPSNAADLIAALNTYVAVVTGSPAAYGTTAGKVSAVAASAADLQSAVTDQEAKIAAARSATEDKDALYDAAALLYREANKVAQATTACTPSMKEAAGLPVPDDSRTPAPVPSVIPVVIVERTSRLEHTLRIIDPAHPRGGKPADVAGYQVFYKNRPDPADQRPGLRLRRQLHEEPLRRHVRRRAGEPARLVPRRPVQHPRGNRPALRNRRHDDRGVR